MLQLDCRALIVVAAAWWSVVAHAQAPAPAAARPAQTAAGNAETGKKLWV